MIATASSVSSSPAISATSVRLERVDQLLAHPVVHLGEHVAVEQVGQRRGERAAVVAVDQLEQVGDVGRVERLDQRARAFGVARLDPLDHLADEFGLQPVVLVEPVVGGRGQRVASGVSSSLSLIALPASLPASGAFLGASRRACRYSERGWRSSMRRRLRRADRQRRLRMADELNTLVLNLDSGGDVVIRLRPDLAPGHVERISELAERRLLRRCRLPPRHRRLHGAGRRSRPAPAWAAPTSPT